MQQTLAETVKAARKAQALSQEELAKRSGVSFRTIWNLENGFSVPRGGTLRGIADALDLDISALTSEVVS